jgi:hypothetical protein
METKALKKQAAFRLEVDLLGKLKQEAQKVNRSLNSYVECILKDSVYNVPNKTTLAAMKDAEEGKYVGIADISSVEAFLKSCEE